MEVGCARVDRAQGPDSAERTRYLSLKTPVISILRTVERPEWVSCALLPRTLAGRHRPGRSRTGIVRRFGGATWPRDFPRIARRIASHPVISARMDAPGDRLFLILWQPVEDIERGLEQGFPRASAS